MPGNSDSQCGKNNNPCVNCSNTGKECQNNECVEVEPACSDNWDCNWPCGSCVGGDCEDIDHSDGDEPNGTYGNATYLGYVNESSDWLDDGNAEAASIFPEGDVDVYYFEVEDTIIPGTPRPAASIESFLAGNMTLLNICIYYSCKDGGANKLESFSCPYGWSDKWNGLDGCCRATNSTGATGYVRIDDLDCSNYYDDGEAFVVVGKGGTGYTCSETGYDFKWGED